MVRLSKEKYYLDVAKSVCKRSTCLKRRYGAVIVNNDEIVATGYNGNPRTLQNCCDKGVCNRINAPHNSGDYSDCHSVHAEQNAMISASRRDMIGATLYLYGEETIGCSSKGGKITKSYFVDIYEGVEPCPICTRMLLNSGIENVIVKNPTELGFKCLDLKELYKGYMEEK